VKYLLTKSKDRIRQMIAIDGRDDRGIVKDDWAASVTVSPSRGRAVTVTVGVVSQFLAMGNANQWFSCSGALETEDDVQRWPGGGVRRARFLFSSPTVNDSCRHLLHCIQRRDSRFKLVVLALPKFCQRQRHSDVREHSTPFHD
jgi:hypothetical protein